MRPGKGSRVPQKHRSEGPGAGPECARFPPVYQILIGSPEVGTAAFHQKIPGFWHKSHSGSPNKNKSTQALSSRGQSSPPFAARFPHPRTLPRTPAADPPGHRPRVLFHSPQNPARQAAAEDGTENASPPGQPRRDQRSRGPSGHSRTIAGGEAVPTLAWPIGVFTRVAGVDRAGSGREGAGRQ